MGGCGTALCLVIAMLIVCRSKSNRRLAQLGCTLYQGYLYSPALPLDGFITYIQRMGVRLDALAGESGSVLPSSDDGGCRELVRYPAGSGDDDCV